MQLNEYMQEKFPNLGLRPPLFYSWDVGIRFELGVEWKSQYNYPNSPYIQGCYKRAITLFESLHSPTDEIYIVIDVNGYDQEKNIKRKFKSFAPYVEKPLLYKLNHQIMPYIFPTHRFTLKCKVSDLKYIPLLKAVCNQDFGIRPTIDDCIYFINTNKDTIFHVYDDRGCDLLATSPEAIRDSYITYNDWILDYDRPKIDKVFK